MVQVCKQTLFYAYLLYFWLVVLKKMTIQEFSIRGDWSNFFEKSLVIVYSLNHLYFYSKLTLYHMQTFTIFSLYQSQTLPTKIIKHSMTIETLTLAIVYTILAVRLTIIYSCKWDKILTRHKNFLL
jgi:hypothetical protein